MSKWTWNEDANCWTCPYCELEWGDMFDDEDMSPHDFGFDFCPNCGAELKDSAE